MRLALSLRRGTQSRSRTLGNRRRMSVAVANNQTTSPSAWQLQRVVAMAQATVVSLREDDGLIIETDDEVMTALSEEGVDVADVLRRLVQASLQAKADAAAAKQRITDLQMRRERFVRQEDAYRATVAAVMEALNLTSFRDPEFTLSLRAGQPKVLITDAGKIPPQLIEVSVIRTPDKAAIRTALDNGEDVPGASLSNGSTILTVNTK